MALNLLGTVEIQDGILGVAVAVPVEARMGRVERVESLKETWEMAGVDRQYLEEHTLDAEVEAAEPVRRDGLSWLPVLAEVV